MNVIRRHFITLVSLGSLLAAARAELPRDNARVRQLGLVVKQGDIVFRATSSAEGRAVRGIEWRGRFSHVGLAVEGAPDVKLIHALPAEYRRANGVILSNWEEFSLAPDVSTCAIFRLRDLTPTEAKTISDAARSGLGRRFTMGFARPDPEGVYCTRFVMECLEQADPEVADYVRPSRVPFVKEPVILPDALLAWPRLYLVDEA